MQECPQPSRGEAISQEPAQVQVGVDRPGVKATPLSWPKNAIRAGISRSEPITLFWGDSEEKSGTGTTLPGAAALRHDPGDPRESIPCHPWKLASLCPCLERTSASAWALCVLHRLRPLSSQEDLSGQHGQPTGLGAAFLLSATTCFTLHLHSRFLPNVNPTSDGIAHVQCTSTDDDTWGHERTQMYQNGVPRRYSQALG